MYEQIVRAGKNLCPIIIAELGAKYADLDVMRIMIERAKESGADIVKFQTYRAETIATPGSYFTMEDGSKVSQYDFFKKTEMTPTDHSLLVDHCCSVGIKWLSTPSHPDDVDLLETFNPIAYKTGSDDLTNLPLIQYIATKRRPMIVSTGMSTLGEIERAVETIWNVGNNQIVLLHCVVSYPSKPEDANLRVIETLRRAFGLPVGLSDHTQDEFTSILAAQMGAVLIEKHFTINHSLNLPDHEASLDSTEFSRMVQRVRLVHKSMGNGIKTILETEKKWRTAARKSIFSARMIRQGSIISSHDLTIRRPGDGIHPHLLNIVIGRRALCDIPANTLLNWSLL